MKDYKRLTNRGEPFYGFEKCRTCEYGKDGCDNWCDQITGCFCRLQELEDKIESGELCDREELIEHLMAAKDTSTLTDKEIEFFIKHNEEVRKETAREIADWLRGWLEWDEEGVVREIMEKYGLEDEE